MIHPLTKPTHFIIDTYLHAKVNSSSLFNIIKKNFTFIADSFQRLYNCILMLLDRIIHPFRQPQIEVNPIVNKMNLSWSANTLLTAQSLHTALTEATKEVCSNMSYCNPKIVIHRFLEIKCPESTAVGDGLHANLVNLGANHKTVLTQMPLPHRGGLPFWKFASQNEPHWILDLTQSHEGPSSYHDLPSDVRCIQQEQSDCHNFFSSTFQFEDTQIHRLRFSNWVDRETISVKELKQILTVMGQKAGENTPWIVHCRAGVGRTGTVVVARALASLAKQGLLTRENLLPTIAEFILMGRQQRGTSFVQSFAQHKLLIDFGLDLIDNSSWFKIPNLFSLGKNLFQRIYG